SDGNRQDQTAARVRQASPCAGAHSGLGPMTPHDWYVENRVAFVARALEASEERLFSDHLPRCEECRREVARLERDLGALPMAATPVAPRPGLTHHLADAILYRRVWWRRAGPAAAVYPDERAHRPRARAVGPPGYVIHLAGIPARGAARYCDGKPPRRA